MQDLIDIIDRGFEAKGRLDTDGEQKQLVEAVNAAIAMLESPDKN